MWGLLETLKGNTWGEVEIWRLRGKYTVFFCEGDLRMIVCVENILMLYYIN